MSDQFQVPVVLIPEKLDKRMNVSLSFLDTEGKEESLQRVEGIFLVPAPCILGTELNELHFVFGCTEVGRRVKRRPVDSWTVVCR